MDYYIPNRKNKITEKQENNNSKTKQKYFEYEISADDKVKILKEYFENLKIKEIFKEIEESKENNNKILNLAQFKRFYKFIEEKNFDFFDKNKEVENFVQKQKDRKIAEKFYSFIENEFMSKESKLELKENEELRDNFCVKAKQRLEILEKYLLYIFGKKRLNKNKKNHTKTEVE